MTMLRNDHLDLPCPDAKLHDGHCTHSLDGDDWCCRDPYRGEPVPECPPAAELEAVHVGLTAEQEIRDRALGHAVDFAGEAIDWDDARDGVAEVLTIASRFASWIADGDPPPAPDTHEDLRCDSCQEGNHGLCESKDCPCEYPDEVTA